MTKRFRSWLIGMLMVSGALMQGVAQQADPPSLQEVLAKVAENYAAYLHTVPNLYADERMVSNVTFIRPFSGPSSTSAIGAHAENQHVSYDSHYRLRRVSGSDDQRLLEETRQIVAVDHQAVPPNQKLAAPNLVLIPNMRRMCFALDGDGVSITSWEPAGGGTAGRSGCWSMRRRRMPPLQTSVR